MVSKYKYIKVFVVTHTMERWMCVTGLQLFYVSLHVLRFL